MKFRAWDGLNKKMSFWTMNDLCTYQDKDEKPSALEEWMSWTGLKDKNGKEIFNGDILKTESGICEVKWYDKGACFRWMFDGNSESPLNYDDIEIIGNVYESPELLTPSTQ